MTALSRLGSAGLLSLPAALVAYLGFEAGGFFPGTPAFAALILAQLLVLRTMLAENPFEGQSRVLVVVAGALSLYALWTLASALWSDSIARALIEFDRVLLYLLALVLFGSVARTRSRVMWTVRSLALGLVIVSVAGLITRTLPDVWSVAPDLANNRLSFPVTYSNALGAVAALAICLCFYLASGDREPRAIRVVGAAAIPPLAVTLLFTFSRGAIIACTAGLAAYVLLGRPRALAGALLSVVPFTAASVVVAYHADLLASPSSTTPTAVSQGHRVAAALAASIVGAGLVRWLLIPLDRWTAGFRLPTRLKRRWVKAAAWVASGAVAVSLLLVLQVPAGVAVQYERFVQTDLPPSTTDFRDRLTYLSNGYRIEFWGTALRGFESAELHGHGAGTYELRWARYRPVGFTATNAHSIYLQNLDELGLVGFALLMLVLVTILGSFASRARGPDRALYAALFAAGLAWAVHAGVDWDWEMPVATVGLFITAGAALARERDASPAVDPPDSARRLAIALGWLLLAVTPAVLFISQGRLDSAVAALARGDCSRAREAAHASLSVFAARSQPYEVLGYCQLADGASRLGIEAMNQALTRDPNYWELHFGLAVARGEAGLDPRWHARAALRLNRHEPLVRQLVGLVSGDDPDGWARGARIARLAALSDDRFSISQF